MDPLRQLLPWPAVEAPTDGPRVHELHTHAPAFAPQLPPNLPLGVTAPPLPLPLPPLLPAFVGVHRVAHRVVDPLPFRLVTSAGRKYVSWASGALRRRSSTHYSSSQTGSRHWSGALSHSCSNGHRLSSNGHPSSRFYYAPARSCRAGCRCATATGGLSRAPSTHSAGGSGLHRCCASLVRKRCAHTRSASPLSSNRKCHSCPCSNLRTLCYGCSHAA